MAAVLLQRTFSFSDAHAVANSIFLLMLCSFTNQVLAQLDVLKYWKETTAYKNDRHLFRKNSMRKSRN